MIVIADSSALVALSVCNSLPLLDRLFGEVKVPPAVYDEVCIANKAESQALQTYLAKKVAYLNNLEVMGSLGVLLLAKRKGLITAIKPLLTRLRCSDIFISEQLLDQLLTLAGE